MSLQHEAHHKTDDGKDEIESQSDVEDYSSCLSAMVSETGVHNGATKTYGNSGKPGKPVWSTASPEAATRLTRVTKAQPRSQAQITDGCFIWMVVVGCLNEAVI
jgi:hypothetical protein